MLIPAQINTLSVDDNIALRMRSFYPEWVPGADCPSGYKSQWSGRLWRCIQAHMSQAGWEPENAPSLWEEICESHSGTADDLIPYSGNMVLTAGLYYVQDGVLQVHPRHRESCVSPAGGAGGTVCGARMRRRAIVAWWCNLFDTAVPAWLWVTLGPGGELNLKIENIKMFNRKY